MFQRIITIKKIALADINYVNMDSDGDISIKYTLDGEKKGYCFNINSGDKKVLI